MSYAAAYGCDGVATDLPHEGLSVAMRPEPRPRRLDSVPWSPPAPASHHGGGGFDAVVHTDVLS